MSEPTHRVDPARASRSQLGAFARFVQARTGLPLLDYPSLHAFSTGDVDLFWGLFLAWSGALTSGEDRPVRAGSGMMESRFFPELRLSWPENLLAGGGAGDDTIAMVGIDESGARTAITRGTLRRRVRSAAAGFASMGVVSGDRVAALARNGVEVVVACLAVTSLGASFSSLPPDMGLATALARLSLLEPRVLLFHPRARHNGASSELAIVDVVSALPTLALVVQLDNGVDGATADAGADGQPSGGAGPRRSTLRAVEGEGASRTPADDALAPAPFPRFPFDHPLFVLFSSGTTGPPKAIVHGHGGTLLEHLKGHRLHCDLGPQDTVCFQTSTGWMMWNWTVSALAAGARVVFYDGSVSYPERDSFLRVAEDEGVTVLGLSPAYLRYLLDAGVEGWRERLRRVRTVLSTGSVLHEDLQRWAGAQLADAPVESISGGTDLLGCFVLGSAWSNTWGGESSCAGLGFDLRAWADGEARRTGRGELVCVQPFPSRPVGLLQDPDGARLRQTYYAQHPGAWTHGDLVELTGHGTVRVLGRCDGMLNIKGIRIGPSEIYAVLARAVAEIDVAMAVDADAADEPGGKRLILFVVLRRGVELDRALTLRIKKALREGASAAHVPAFVVPLDALPVTFSNKVSEAAMQDALSGRPVRNLTALRNPEAIGRALSALQRAQAAPIGFAARGRVDPG